MKKGLPATAVAMAAVSPSGASAADLPPGFPVMSAHEIAVRCDVELEHRRNQLERMERHAGPGRILDEFNALSLRSGGFDDPLAVLQNASPDKEVRTAALDCLERLVPFSTELFQSTRVYARVQAFKATEPEDQAYRRLLLENFEDAGASLAEDQRVHVKAIQDELNTLGLRFRKNVNDVDTTVALTAQEVDGLPEEWRAARKRDAGGNFLVTLDYPCYGPFMEMAVNEDARRRVWTAFQNRAAPQNLALLDRALVLRSELAQVYGFPDFATFSLRRKMAGSPRASRVW